MWKSLLFFMAFSSLGAAAADSGLKAIKHDLSAGKKAWEKHELFEAENLFSNAVAESDRISARNAQLTTALKNLGEVRLELGRLPESEADFKRCLALDETAHGSNDLRTIVDVLDVADVSAKQNHFAEADALLIRAQNGMTKLFGAKDRMVGVCLLKRANLLVDEGKFDEAEPMCVEALRLIESPRFQKSSAAIDPPDRQQVIAGLIDLGLVYRKEKKFAAAEDTLKRALAESERAYGKKDAHLVTPLNDLALVYADERRFADAEQLFARSASILRTAPSLQLQLTSTEEMLAQARRAQGKAESSDGSPKS